MGIRDQRLHEDNFVLHYLSSETSVFECVNPPPKHRFFTTLAQAQIIHSLFHDFHDLPPPDI